MSQAEILKLLYMSNRPLTFTEIRERVGGSLSRALRSLQKQGLITKIHIPKYSPSSPSTLYLLTSKGYKEMRRDYEKNISKM